MNSSFWAQHILSNSPSCAATTASRRRTYGVVTMYVLKLCPCCESSHRLPLIPPLFHNGVVSSSAGFGD
ncbi:hypothetical protein PISMIDRAFT_518947 [Pisolithus microcarpus 441]|uniref:Uncharacterized protein n=1 Tax=Pisolithus microcarpus 441 TaxID=765257 RepID=A0A0D0AAX0_9AGAM|nr:hypothetical protein PISMIDRAFT_518947 [Pisolithus microcarpus 441]